MRGVISFIFCLLTVLVQGQSSQELTFESYMKIVSDNHPISYQANLLSEEAKNNERVARGGFDPKISGSFNQKSFDGKNYYALSEGVLKVPTWYGIELKSAYNRSSGEFLNGSDVLPLRGLWSAGISIPLGKGLVIDKRRAELQKAKTYQNMAVQKQKLMMNQLLFDAAYAYLDWQVSISYLEIAVEGRELAQQRFEGTKKGFENGDLPAIDTLESYLAIQSRALDLSKAKQRVSNSILQLNNFMWISGSIPLELELNTVPEPIEVEILSNVVDSLSIRQNEWLANHPELLLYEYKLDNMEVDLRLSREEIKPDVRVNYNPLLAVGANALFDQFSIENYKLGASVSYPLFQRKESGMITINRIKIQDTEYERLIKNQDLSVKLNTYMNNVNLSEEQYNLLQLNVDNYESLLRAENRKFEVGESSIFLVNAREMKYLESRYKLINTAQKLLTNKFKYLLFANGFQDVI